jgi:enoyl reductase-like protein
MMAKIAKWQQKFIDDVEEMTLPELLDALLEVAQGDSYDGESTSRGNWRYGCVVKVMEQRIEVALVWKKALKYLALLKDERLVGEYKLSSFCAYALMGSNALMQDIESMVA